MDTQDIMRKYGDIISLPHHVSNTHPHMPVADRAAQFAPFAALTGYGEVIKETARRTDAEPELTEDEKERLRAAELLGKRFGLFRDKVDVSGAAAVTIIDDMGAEDD